MKKLTQELVDSIDFTEKLSMRIYKDRHIESKIRLLRKFLGGSRNSLTTIKAIEFLAYKKVDFNKDLFTQITYSEKTYQLISTLRNNTENFIGSSENKERGSNFSIELWKIILCNEYFIEQGLHFKNADDFLKTVIDKSAEIQEKLLSRKR